MNQSQSAAKKTFTSKYYSNPYYYVDITTDDYLSVLPAGL